MKSNREIVESEIPEQAFFTLRELERIGPYSAEYWSKAIRAGEVRVVQRSAHRHGSTIFVPRGEYVRHVSEKIR